MVVCCNDPNKILDRSAFFQLQLSLQLLVASGCGGKKSKACGGDYQSHTETWAAATRSCIRVILMPTSFQYMHRLPKKNHQERLGKLPVLALRCSLQSATIGPCGIPSLWFALWQLNGDVFPYLVGRSWSPGTTSMWPQELPCVRLCGVKPLGFSKMWRKPNSRCPRPSVSSNWRWNSSDHNLMLVISVYQILYDLRFLEGVYLFIFSWI